MTLKIGNIELPHCVLPAPMAGVTDKPFRLLVREFDCTLVYTEMVSDNALVMGTRKTKAILDLTGESSPIAVQLFGSDPVTLARAARIAEEEGASLIDLNMGCPTPKIVKNGEGAALMRNPELASQIVSAVRAAVSVPVTVKLRKGWDENSVNAVEIARLAESCGASAVTVHGRTRDQFYSGAADWTIIKAVKQSLKIPVIGNGDIWKPEDARQMLEQTGCDGVMIGRGALGNPWLFRRTIHYLKTGELLPEPTLEERKDTSLRHLELMVAHKGEKVAVREMRKHLAWYLKGLPGAARARVLINKAGTVAEHREIMNSFFGGRI